MPLICAVVIASIIENIKMIRNITYSPDDSSGVHDNKKIAAQNIFVKKSIDEMDYRVA